MKSHTFVHERKPKSKERPRNGRGHTYTPKASREYEADVAANYDGPKFEGPVKVYVGFYKDHTIVTIEAIEGEEPTKLRGDVDNYVKSILDGLNGVAYDDDRQVVRLSAAKNY